jgi:hypothetical protein
MKLMLLKPTPFVFAVAVLAALALPVAAHHSFNAEYDDTKPVTVTGTVTKVEWQNPHIWFFLDVKESNGTVSHWAFSGGAPGQLMRRASPRMCSNWGQRSWCEAFALRMDPTTARAAR